MPSNTESLYQNLIDATDKQYADLKGRGMLGPLTKSEKDFIASYEGIDKNKDYPLLSDYAKEGLRDSDGPITMKLIPPRTGSESVYLHGKYSIGVLRRLVQVFDDATTEQESGNE